MDGFKCYTEKTTVKNLDIFFTAITGMNGSGKSNIVDAILFTLDLSTSKYMRVSSFKELINTNRKECMASVVFDNTDKEKSPAGYESYDTIEITRSLDCEGKSKYKLNGHNSTKGTIENLCKSIGITNDFVVMQGHITKIVNMKGVDLRNMVEETAGTRNYSLEREKSLEMLSKKEAKLREVREHLKKTISPFFDQLKNEKKMYEDNRDIEINRKRYQKEMVALERSLASMDLSSKVDELRKMGRQYETEKAELEDVEKKIKKLDEVQVSTVNDLSIQINKEKVKLEELRVQDPGEQLLQKQQELEKHKKLLAEPVAYGLHELKGKEAILAREMIGSGDVDKVSELERMKTALNKKSTEIKMIRSEIDRKMENSDLKRHFKTDFSEAMLRDVQKALDGYEADIAKMRSYDERISLLKSKILYPIIDGVYGTVDENFEFIDEKYKEAILTILGGRSKFVICRDDVVASKVIQASERKLSCIPLNKITFFEPGRVPYNGINALNAIAFDKRDEKAFKHIFSGFYLFEGKKEAAGCCFECKVMCVTLDGTVYDPKGTLTGGKSHMKYDVTKLTELKRLEEERKCLETKVHQYGCFGDVKSISSLLSSFLSFSKENEILKKKVEILQDVIGCKVDIKSELQRIRTEIVEATKEDRTRSDIKNVVDKLTGEINDLDLIKREIDEKMAHSTERVRQLQVEQKSLELEENSRRASTRLLDSFDERRKKLIKSTVNISSRISRAKDEVNELAERVFQSENPTNQSFIGEEMSAEDLSVVASLERTFGIDKQILLFNCSRFINYENANNKANESANEFGVNDKLNSKINESNRNKIEERIKFLKEKISQKRIVLSMDPSIFELLEKNAAAVQNLEEKIRKLENDKVEILKCIERLNEIGLKENNRAFEHINSTLGRFLGYFLKNSDAMISPEFEIRVKIGTWKNSLSELSGGQKSLVALCLIFSMLTYKPAPFYIFDEIDAALDLNYTQSIGEIIRKEFRGAQFIVVSLKNNMFDNANKIFRVFIQDQRSKVCLIKG